jgi:hypothetical protein
VVDFTECRLLPGRFSGWVGKTAEWQAFRQTGGCAFQHVDVDHLPLAF